MTRGACLACFAILSWCVLGGHAAADTPTNQGFMSVDEVQPGMRGVGRTVFSGTEISEFGVEIIGVLRNTRPHGDLILFRGEGETLAHTGIIRGMSGSPVYIDGRLVGAVSFAYPNSKDPIGAITPIAEMMDLLVPNLGEAQRTRGTEGAPVPPVSSDRAPGTSSSPYSTLGDRALFDQLWDRFRGAGDAEWSDLHAQMLGRVPVRGNTSAIDLQPMATPISMSGWNEALGSEIQSTLQELGFLAASTTTGSSGSHDAPTEFEPGSAVGVQMIGGAADMVAIGTVTYTDADRILAFGHPMMQSGDVAFPMSGAWIHTVLPNRQVSIKMGSSTPLVGGIWNDRRAGVAGLWGEVPSQLPVRVRVETDRGEQEDFHYELARHDLLTPFFLPWTVTNSYLSSGWVFGDASIRTEVTVHYNGGAQVRRVERLATGVPGTALGPDITLPATLLLTNPFERVRIDSVAVGVTYEKRNPSASVMEVRADHHRVEVGDRVQFDVEIKPYRGETRYETLELAIPAAWAGKSLRVQVGATVDFQQWDQERAPQKFVPYSLRQMGEMIERMPDESTLTMRVYSVDQGTLLQGVELPSLPPSVASAAFMDVHPRSTVPIDGSLLREEHHKTQWVLRGGETVALEVAE